MTKNELIKVVAEQTGCSLPQARAGVEEVLNAIQANLSWSGEVEIKGFGRFLVTHRHSHTTRNPRTGEPMWVPETRSPHFRPGKLLKEAVNRLH